MKGGARRLIAAGTLLITGCATMVNREPAPVHVRSSPPGATATARCQGAVVASGITPATLGVPRQATGCSIHVSHEGFRSQTVELTRGRSGAYWGNLGFFGPLPIAAAVAVFGADPSDNLTTYSVIGALAVTGVVGFVTDRSNGSMYVHEPDEIDVTLEAAPR